jgi:hypothetical protein
MQIYFKEFALSVRNYEKHYNCHTERSEVSVANCMLITRILYVRFIV